MRLQSHFGNVSACNFYVIASSVIAVSLAGRSSGRAKRTSRRQHGQQYARFRRAIPQGDIGRAAGHTAGHPGKALSVRTRCSLGTNRRLNQRLRAIRSTLAGACGPAVGCHCQLQCVIRERQQLAAERLCRHCAARASRFPGARPRTSCCGSRAGRRPARHRPRSPSGSVPACCAHHRSGCRPCRSRARSASS